MEKQDIINFFDQRASGWDDETVRREDIIRTILDNARITPGQRVLDVACGTGVLFPDYLARGITDLTAIDIAPAMAHIAKEKYPHVCVLCGDAETYAFSAPFDRIMVYNAFPHFPDPERLIRRLAGLLTPGGVLCIAHGMSRRALEAHHAGCAGHVSRELPPAEDIAALMGKFLTADTVIDNDAMYQVCGFRKTVL